MTKRTLRLTGKDAAQMGLISVDEGQRIDQAGRRIIPGAITGEAIRQRHARAIAEDSPQSIIQRACIERWPGIAFPEYQGAVPGRQFRLDVGMPDVKVACEVDGWEHHGRFLSDFKRDRERDRALVENGWRVIRFYASEVKADIGVVLECVERVRTMVLRGK